MARTVSSTIALPSPLTVVHAEIADGPVASVAEALNTLVEAHRGSLIADSGTADVPILGLSAEDVEYRVPIIGEPGAVEPAQLYARGRIQAAGSATLRVQSTGGADSATQAITSTTAAWYDLGTIDIDVDAEDYETIAVDVSTSTAEIELTDLVLYYERSRTALLACGSGLETYASGETPEDLDAAAGERPLTATRLRTRHETARALYARPQPAVATATGDASGLHGAVRAALLNSPTLGPNSGRTAELRVDCRLHHSGGSDASATVVVAGQTLTLTVSAGTSWASGTLNIAAPSESSDRPREVRATIYEADEIRTLSWCAWWRSLTYA